MRLAIIDAGNVGGTLGTAWAQKAGHEIFFSVRNPRQSRPPRSTEPPRAGPSQQDLLRPF
jgi:predicted dinucleotide-binding enzyme